MGSESENEDTSTFENIDFWKEISHIDLTEFEGSKIIGMNKTKPNKLQVLFQRKNIIKLVKINGTKIYCIKNF